MRLHYWLSVLILTSLGAGRAAPQEENVLIEEWRGEYLADKKIGYSYTILEALADPSDATSAGRYRLTSFIAVPSQKIMSRAVAETGPDFTLRLLRIESEAQGTRTEAEGSLVGENLVIRVLSGGAVSQKLIPAGDGVYLADVVPWLIVRRGLEAGSKAVFHVFDPTVFSGGKMEVEVIGWETPPEAEECDRALRLKANYLGIPMDLWVDKEGGLCEAHTSIMNTKSLRETRERLESSADFADLDQEELIRQASIPSNARLSNPARLTSLILEIRRLPAEVEVPEDPGQEILERDGENLRLHVRREWPSGRESVDQAKLEPFLRPSLLVQSDDPRIRERSGEIVGDTEGATAKARRIADWISRNMKSELRVSTPSAAEILESMRGDCNEHATLFAALCRAAGVPTKICAGIVYQDGRFYYHAWNEIFDPGEGWVRVDTAFDQFPADPTHVKLAEGDLEEHVLIAQLVGKIELEIIESESGEG